MINYSSIALDNRQNKKALEMSFAWIFAILVGAVIIILAVYTAVKIIDSQRRATDSATAKELSTLLTPVETNLESAKTTSIAFSKETRLFNECNLNGNFGTQLISTAASSGIGNEWEKPGVASRFYNKYLFSSNPVQGKTLYILTKPFFMPYKVADLIYIWSENDDYCLVNPPYDMESDVSGLNMKNINVSSSAAECPAGSIKICFSSSGCDVDVNLNSKTVKHRAQKTQVYSDAEGDTLLYAAIFSDSVLYECQLQRLMKRTSELALLYASKSDFLSAKGCTSSSLQAELISYSALLKNATSSLNSVSFMSEQIADSNDALECKLF